MLSFQDAQAPSTEEGAPAATEFKPVEGEAETTSGAMLLIEAYALMWLVAFVFVLLSWRRQRKLDARLAALESALVTAREASPDLGGEKR